jgi:hypothetical protein
MLRKYYRRVWEWRGSWVVVGEGYVEYDDLLGDPTVKLPCVPTLDYPTAACAAPAGTGLSTKEPAYYEIWWRWVPSTWGANGGGVWERASGGGNY